MKRFFLSLPGVVVTVGLVALWFIALYADRSVLGVEPVGTVRTVMQIAMSIIVSAAALYVILSKKYDADVQKWAYGAIGTVMGYWLPSA